MDLTKYAPKKPLMPSLFSGITPSLKMPSMTTTPAVTKPVTPMVTTPASAGGASGSWGAPVVTPPKVTTGSSSGSTGSTGGSPAKPPVPDYSGIMESLKGISASLGSMKDAPAPGTTPVKPELSDTEKTITSLMSPGSDELTTQADLDKITDSFKQGYQNINDKAIPMEFITGQQSSLEKRANVMAEPLEKKLARLQAQRTAALEASKFTLDRADKKDAAAAKAKETEFSQGIETKKLAQIDQKFEEDKRQFGLTYAQNNRKIAIDEAKAASDKAAAAGTNDPVQAKQKLTFLKQTANDALKLSGAAGRSGLRKTIEGVTVGATDYTQLESLTNTLKTNLLTLATDPTIKKFFGPQMSNADVELMMSGGTTLSPEKNKPEQMKAELNRVLSLFNRMDSALGGNLSGGSTIVTAPDGTQIEITD